MSPPELIQAVLTLGVPRNGTVSGDRALWEVERGHSGEPSSYQEETGTHREGHGKTREKRVAAVRGGRLQQTPALWTPS